MSLVRRGIGIVAVLAVIAGCRQSQSNSTFKQQPEGAPLTISEYMPSPAVLVFSGTAGWRHDAGIAGADYFFAELTNERQWGLFTTADPRVFTQQHLDRFDLIVFNNVTGEVLSTAEQRAFETWMSDGGAWIGLHGAGDGSMSHWTWYQQQLIGTRFIGHTMAPQFQTADVVGLSSQHPVVEGLPPRWAHHDEWYSFDQLPDPTRFELLLGIDESTYEPANPVVERWPADLRMGATPQQHPLVWSRETELYRSVYSAIGHDLTSYQDPHYRTLLEQAVDWVSSQER